MQMSRSMSEGTHEGEADSGTRTDGASGTAVSSLDYALALWRRGLSVIPVPLPVPGSEKGRPGDGKVPAIAWKEYQKRQATEAEVRAWFGTDQNIAVVTGALSNVVVVDADSPEAERWVRRNLLRTPWRVRTGRGLHLYYRHAGVIVRNKARLHTREGRLQLDVRGDGGYVIGPGSRHASGHIYAAEGDWTTPSSKLPAFWVGLLEQPHPPGAAASRVRRLCGDIVNRGRSYLAAIPRPEIGCGSDAATWSAACHLVRGFELNDIEAVELLWEWAGGRPGWDRDYIESKVRNARKYGEEPMGALR